MRRRYSDFVLGAIWLAAALIVLLPLIVAADYGGVLRWTQHLAALAIVVIAAISLVAIREHTSRRPWQRFALLAPLGLWAGYSWMQTIPLPATLVGLMSPGVAESYTQWAAALVPSLVGPMFPASVSAFDTAHAAAWLTMMLPLAAASALIFHTRSRWILLLGGIAAGGALLAAFGILRLTAPNAPMFAFIATDTGAPFGTFVNRNNAALMLNLGMAASLGLLSWRLMALTGQQVDDAEFEFNDLLALISERESAIGMIGAVLCSVGLMASGSRAGLAAAVVGLLLAFGWVRRRRGLVSAPVIAVAVALACAILIIPLNLNLETMQRMQQANGASRTLLNDGRFQHWPEGWEAATTYLPGGAGLSTYAYAYLPFQQSGPSSWFRHADNMWLQWFVEQGIAGILFPLAILLLVIRALNRLSDSPDALDAGIRTAGWYAIGAILFSQFFDSGLIAPANSILVTIAAAAVISRSVSVASLMSEAESETEGRVRKRARAGRTVAWPTIALPVASVLAGLLATIQLSRSATAESLVYAANAQLQQSDVTAQQLQPIADRLQQSVERLPAADLSNALAEVRHRQARLRDVRAAAPRSDVESRELYAATGRQLRRLLHREQASTGFIADDLLQQIEQRIPAEPTHYRSALQAYRASLVDRPLDPIAREGLLYLDFIDADPEQTEVLLRQLARLYHNSAGWAFRLGNFAVESGRTQTATELYRHAILRDVDLTVDVVRQADYHNAISIADVVPDHPPASRIAASRILHGDTQRSWHLLPVFLQRLHCDQCESVDQKALCHALAGDVAFAAEKFDLAFEHYLQAMAMSPLDANLRLKVIRRLRESGRHDQAMKQARIGMQQIPADVRFQELIDSISQSRMRDFESDLVPTLP